MTTTVSFNPRAISPLRDARTQPGPPQGDTEAGGADLGEFDGFPLLNSQHRNTHPSSAYASSHLRAATCSPGVPRHMPVMPRAETDSTLVRLVAPNPAMLAALRPRKDGGTERMRPIGRTPLPSKVRKGNLRGGVNAEAPKVRWDPPRRSEATPARSIHTFITVNCVGACPTPGTRFWHA